MSRLEAAAKEMTPVAKMLEATILAQAVLTAADAHDAAHNVHRTPESEVTALIVERDEAQWWADKLAAMLAPADVLGEHSSMNSPWANALEYAAGTQQITIDDATVERAARALDPKAWDETAIMFVAHSQSPEDARASRQNYACADARRALAAAVKEERA